MIIGLNLIYLLFYLEMVVPFVYTEEEMQELREENRKLNEKVRFLEECLDNKEKVNISLREELEKLKSTYVYDAKQVRDIC